MSANGLPTARQAKRRAVVRGAADLDALPGNGRNPEVEGLRSAGDAAGRHDHAALRADADLLAGVDVRRFDSGHRVLLLVEEDAGERSAFVDADLAVLDFLHEDIDVVLALVAFLANRAQVAVARVLLEVVRGEAVVLKPVEGFAGILREELDRFLEGHVGAVVHDVVGEFLPGVVSLLALLDRGTVGRVEAAAHAGGGLVGAVGLVEDDDGALLVVDLAGGHQAGAAGAADNDVNREIPFRGSGGVLAGSGKGRSGSGSGAGCGSSREEVTAGERSVRHFLFSLELAVSDRVAIAADVVALRVHGVALGAFEAAHVGVVGIELLSRLGGQLRELLVGAVALEAGLLGGSGGLRLPGVAGLALEARVGAVRSGAGSEGGRWGRGKGACAG